jgi:endonuclease YncB( thermonuclease family)
LSINRPRRIFRSSLPRPQAKVVAAMLGAALMAAAGIALAVLPHGEPSPAPFPATATRELSARPGHAAIIDGATLRLGDRVVILRGVEPPPRGTLCAQRDAPVHDCGAAAANALAALVQDRPVACRLTGADAWGRPLAACQADNLDLARAMIAAGWGRAEPGQPALRQEEARARAERRGLWASSR